MSGVKYLILGAAVAAGVGAVALVQSELDRARNVTGVTTVEVERLDRTEVLVAARSLSRGEALRDGAVKWADWPTELVAEGFVTRDEQPDAIAKFERALAKGVIADGEPIKPEKLVMLDRPGVMSALLRNGMRAFAIKISQETGAGGFVLPADYVDVIFTYTREVEVCGRDGQYEDKDFLEVLTLLRTVRVLAVDTEFDAGDEASSSMERTATLEVTPRQAEILSLAEEAGRLTLALRGLTELIGADGKPIAEPFPELVVDLDFAAELATLAAKGSVRGSDATHAEPKPAGGASLALSGADCAADAGPTVTIVRGARVAGASIR